MKKYLFLITVLLLTVNCALSMPMSATVSQDYDLGFESVVKRKFSEILKFSKIFEKNDDIFYQKGYRPIYMLSIKELYYQEPVVKSNIEKRKIPNTYNISFASNNVKSTEKVSFIEREKFNITDIENIEKDGDFNKIQNRYRKLIVNNPERIELLYKYAQFLYKNSKYKEAIAVLNDIISKDSGFVLASYTLGNIYFDLGEYKNAIKANLAVIKRNPYCADAYYNIASALERMQKFSLAMDYYQKCLSINQNDIQAQKAIERLEQITYNK